MRHSTLIELAAQHGVRLPDALVDDWPPKLSATDEKGWFRFQRLYDIARSVLRSEADVRRLLLEAAQDDATEGSGWLEIQVDPSGYGSRFGGISAFTDLVLDAARSASATTDVGIAVGSATDLARETAGIVLPEGGLRLLPWVFELSWAVRRTILTNLLWAFGYNSIGLVLAVTGHLQPVIAAVLMAGSSLLVVLSSLRLERFAEPSDHPRLEEAPAAERGAPKQDERPRVPAPRPAT